MIPTSEAAMRAARRLWREVAADASAPDEVAAATDRVCSRVRQGLDRWIGRPGYRSLMERALRVTVTAHPALGNLSFDEGDESATMAAVQEYGAQEVVAGMIVLVATVIDLLGRLIGDRMAMRLVEHWGDRARADIDGPDTEEALDG